MITNYKRIHDFGLVGGIGKGGSFNKRNDAVSYSLCRPKAKAIRTESIAEFKARGGKVKNISDPSYVDLTIQIAKLKAENEKLIEQYRQESWVPVQAK